MRRPNIAKQLISWAVLSLGVAIYLLVNQLTAWATVTVGPSTTADQTSQSPQNPVNSTNLEPQGNLQQGTSSNVLGDSTTLNLNTLPARALAVTEITPTDSHNATQAIEVPSSHDGFSKLLDWIIIGGFIVAAVATTLYIYISVRHDK